MTDMLHLNCHPSALDHSVAQGMETEGSEQPKSTARQNPRMLTSTLLFPMSLLIW